VLLVEVVVVVVVGGGRGGVVVRAGSADAVGDAVAAGAAHDIGHGVLDRAYVLMELMVLLLVLLGVVVDELQGGGGGASVGGGLILPAALGLALGRATGEEEGFLLGEEGITSGGGGGVGTSSRTRGEPTSGVACARRQAFLHAVARGGQARGAAVAVAAASVASFFFFGVRAGGRRGGGSDGGSGVTGLIPGLEACVTVSKDDPFGRRVSIDDQVAVAA